MKYGLNSLLLAGCVTCCVGIGSADSARAAELLVHVDGIQGTAGNMRLALFAAGDFMNYDRVLRRSITQIRGGRARFLVSNLPPGKYSFTILHDANANAEADRNFLGIPTEGVAVSNNARGFLGPPAEKDAEFVVPDGDADHTVTMVYF